MKRIWAAVGLFLFAGVLCGMSLFITLHSAAALSEQTLQVEQSLRAGAYAESAAQLEEVSAQWERYSPILCCFFSHMQLETGDKELDGLRASLEGKDYSRALEHCGQLSLFWGHLREMDLPFWENIF
ncbi:MAG: DUF4363 family protein [Oscillospiraceae bacterium]|nr:DUF4363 family protein [Oscillospiraceae bacterium]